MWEQRRDGKRKLKSAAIPTIFGFFFLNNTVNTNEETSKKYEQVSIDKYMKIIKSNTKINIYLYIFYQLFIKNQSIINIMLQSNIEDLESNTVKNITESIIVNDIPEYNTENNIVDTVHSIIENNTAKCTTVLTTSTSDTCISESEERNKTKEEKEKCEEKIKKQTLRMIRMQKKMKAMKYIILSLQRKVNNDKYRKALYGIFNEDQITALCTKKQRGRNWSNETVQRALQLKLVCGSNGYEEVLRQGKIGRAHV